MIQQQRQPTGVLLVNVGTPDAPTTSAVRRYLKEFLMDPRVINMPVLLRWLLVHVMILPRRPKQSAALYRSIWTADGSPLLVHGKALVKAVQHNLGQHYIVALGMRYGHPGIDAGLEYLFQKNIKRLVVVPLFPQHANATTGSVASKVIDLLVARDNLPITHFVEPFYDNTGFIGAVAQSIRVAMDDFVPDKLLLSYHGLPRSHVEASHNQTECCSTHKPCPRITANNHRCYRAQCFATSWNITKALGLNNAQIVTAFQSRLGRTPWILPNADEILSDLIDQGVKRLMVATPSFVADCLETLEEIDIRMRQRWLDLGGDDFLLVPCVNATPPWVSTVASLVRSTEH